MDRSAENSAENDGKEKCIAHYWKSAGNTAHISDLTVNTGIKSVALGCEHCLFLGHNGKVFARGCNKFGQLGLGDLVDRTDLTEVQYLSRKNVVDVTCGSRHSGVITVEGHVYCWGDASSGQCGVGEVASVKEPARVYFIDNHGKDTSSVVTQLAFGELHSLGLTDQGQVWAWGTGCTLGLGNDLARAFTPQIIDDLIGKKVISIACGIYHSLAIIDIENSTSVKTSNDTKTTNPVEEQITSRKRTGFSTRIRIPRRNTKDTVERSNSMPITRKPDVSVAALNQPDCSSSSESDNDAESSSKSDINLSDVGVSVANESDASEQSSLSGSIDASIHKLTDAVVKSVSGIISYTTTSLTSQTASITDTPVVSTNGPTVPEVRETTPKTRRKRTKNKTQGYNPVSVQVWAWGRGTSGQLGHGTTEDR
jgi:amyotrophic lateral sclerosis 2 protein